MQFLKTLLIFFHIANAHSFVIPPYLLGKWKTIKNENNIFCVNAQSIFAHHNEGNISMSLIKINDDPHVSIDLRDLCIHKIPKNIDYKNMIHSLRIINQIKKNGLRVEIYHTVDDNIKHIKFESGSIKGEFQIKRHEEE